MKKARTQIVVLKHFQRWFLINFLTYTALFLIVFGLGLFIWLKTVTDELFHVAGLLSETFAQTIQHQLTMGFWMSVILVVVLLALAALQSLLFSRSIAGPIFALSRHLEKCEQEGKLSPIQLRDKDLFRDVADKFNRLAEKVQKSS